MGTQLLGLGEDSIHLLKGQALLMTVLCRPAAGAVHIAGGGGVHQNEPGDIAAILFGVLLGLLIAAEATLIHRVGEEGFENIGVGFVQNSLDIVRPFAIGLARYHAQHLEGFLLPHAALDLFGHIHQLLRGGRGILGAAFFDEVIQYLFESLAFCRMGGFFDQCHSQFPFLSR